MRRGNVLLLTDSYKASHDVQYPPGTEIIESYFEARAGAKWSESVFFGLQYLLKEYLSTPLTMADIDEAESYFLPHMGVFRRQNWEYIVEKHGGRWPVVIEAVAEGTVVPVSNVLMKVRNTDPRCAWLTNYLETLLVQVWYPMTVATQSREMKKIILRYLEETGDPSLIDFKLHDFGCRGVSSMETAAIGGAAHLVNFKGTDTVPALALLRAHYGEQMAGFSIPASEHSTITSWGAEHEVDAMRNMIEQYGSGALYACVSDSYDVLRACTEYWGGALKDAVLTANGTLVVRPDSGKPEQVVPTVLQLLWSAFGGHENEKGYRVLHPKVRVIQGDGIDIQSLPRILEVVKLCGFSADNLAFGSGGGLLQKVNRDTLRCAFKCSLAYVNGFMRPVWKAPVTDPGKRSKTGELQLLKTPKGFETVDLWRFPEEYQFEDYPYLLRPVYRNGELLVDEPLSAIRARAAL